MRTRSLLPVAVISCLLAPLLARPAPAKTLVVNPGLAGADDAGPGTDAQPLRTIGRAAALVQPGDVVRIHSGTYREKVAVTQSGTREQPIRFEAATGATVVVTGADPLTGWQRDGDGVYSIAWTYRPNPRDQHTVGGTEQVIVGGRLLRKAASAGELSADTFFVDTDRKRLCVKADRNPGDAGAPAIEAATRPEVWIVSGEYVHTCGLSFRYASNRAQQAMAQFRAAHGVIEDCIFEWSNSTGANFRGADIAVRRCVFRDNGQQGFTAQFADNMRIDGCTVERNNVKGYDRGWEAGGDKICLSRGVVLENCRFLKNHGSGLWFDISNVDCEVRNCLFADNEDAGIFYEISYGLHAHDNVAVGNGLARTPGAWGSNGGICVSSSPGCRIERNLIVGNEQGFCFREQNRTAPPVSRERGPEVTIWDHDETVCDNLIVGNRTAQVQGWFDIATERHWPKAMQTGKVESRPAKPGKADQRPKRPDGVPAGLSLEDLKIAFTGNIYVLGPGQPFFVWGTGWKRHQEFKDLAAVGGALAFEDRQSRILPALPVDVAKRDFRLSAEVMAAVRRAYPQGRVPDCLLGTRGENPKPAKD